MLLWIDELTVLIDLFILVATIDITIVYAVCINFSINIIIII